MVAPVNLSETYFNSQDSGIAAVLLDRADFRFHP